MKTLYDDYKKFEELAKSSNAKVINLNESLLKPSIMLPLINYSINNNITLKINQSVVNEYLINEDKFSNYIELAYLEESRKNEIIQELALNMNYEEFCGLQSIVYIFNELVTNVLDHSSIKNENLNKFYIYTKEYSDLNLLDVSIMDNGLSIPGNFEYHNIDFIDDCHAISKAVNQFSTKKDSFESIRYSRGFGLWSTLKLVIEGNLGSALIVSRNGCLNIVSKDNHKYYNLNNSNIFYGTLVSLRLRKDKIENFYELIEINESNNYKYKE